MITTAIDVAALLPWSEPREIPHLQRQVRNAEPTESFSALWRDNKAELKSAGVGWSEWPKGSGHWKISWWQPIGGATLAARQESAALSRAGDSEFDPPCPDGLRFYGFQKAGIDFIRRRPASLLADDMGIGKTIQAIGLVNCQPEIDRVLVVTKASLKTNWLREMRKWCVRKLEIDIGTGQRFPSTKCVIINYDVLGKWQSRIRSREWDLIILDESAAIKNREAKRTQAIIGNRKLKIEPLRAKFKLCLSGTPIENRPAELWTTLYWLDPARWGSFWSYAKRYCGLTNNGFGYDFTGASNLDELQRILRETIMIRRRKADVLTELPPKTRIVVEMDADGLEDQVEAESHVQRSYGADLEKAQADIELARAGTDEEFKAAVQRLNGAGMIAFQEMARVRHDTAVRCVPMAIEAIKADIEEVGIKQIIFAHHRDVLQPLHEAFQGSVIITGETPAELRQGICDRFQTEPNCGPFFGSIRACGEGLTLTAAKLVSFFESDWAPGKNSQAEDRAHRIGQKDNVLVKYYVLGGTISAKMVKTCVEKQEVIDRALDTDPGEWAAPIVTEHKPLARRKELAQEAVLITQDEIGRIHAALQRLAGACDGAIKRDECGFNGVDARIGHSLAGCSVLTPKQAILGKKLIQKYKHTQLKGINL